MCLWKGIFCSLLDPLAVFKGWFYILAIVNYAAIKMSVQIFLDMLVLFSWIYAPKSVAFSYSHGHLIPIERSSQML